MAKKRRKHKKHAFKYAAPAQNPPMQASAKISEPAPKDRQPARAQLAGVADFGYVGKDLRVILVLAAGFILLELVLWYLFEHTGLGAAVYNLIKV